MSDTKTYPQQHTPWKPACMVFNNGRILPVGIYAKEARRVSDDGKYTEHDMQVMSSIIATDEIINKMILNAIGESNDSNSRAE